MCKNFFENMHRILVLIRSDMQEENNTELLEFLITSIDKGWKNTEMLESVSKILPDIKQQLVLEDDEVYEINNKAKEYMLHVLRITWNALKEGNYELAYDLVDMLHVFPHLVISNDKKQIKDYWKIYVNPVVKRRNIKKEELFVFRECRR